MSLLLGKSNMAVMMASVGQRIEAARKAAKLSQQALATRMEVSRGTVAMWESDKNSPPIAKVLQIADQLNVSPELLAFGVSDSPAAGNVAVDELTFDEHPEGGTVVATWSLPESYLDDVGVSKKACFVFSDRSGKLIIDRAGRRPTPPGRFLIWDGVGMTVARLSVIPGAGKVRVETEGLEPMEAPLELSEVGIGVVGRVIAVLATEK